MLSEETLDNQEQLQTSRLAYVDIQNSEQEILPPAIRQIVSSIIGQK